MDQQKVFRPPSGELQQRTKKLIDYQLDEHIDKVDAGERQGLDHAREIISSETSIIEEAFEVIFRKCSELAINCRDEEPRASKLLKNQVGIFKFRLHNLNLYDGQLDKFLAESDRLRAAVYSVLLRLVCVFIRASKFLHHYSVQINNEFSTLEEKLRQAIPSIAWNTKNAPEKDKNGTRLTSFLTLCTFAEFEDESDSSSSTSSSSSGDEYDEEHDELEMNSNPSDNEPLPLLDNNQMSIRKFVDKLTMICENFCLLASTISDSMEIALVDEIIHKESNNPPPPCGVRDESTPLDYIQDKLSHLFPKAEKYLLERLAWESWHLHCSVRKGIEQRQQLKEKAQREADSTYSSLEQSVRAPSLNGGLQKTITPATNEIQSYAMSIATSVSSLALGNRPKEPRPPVDLGENITFICPICSQSLSSINNRRAWRKHVLSDLQPYVCTIRDCPSASNRYMNRISWMQHEKTHLQNTEKEKISQSSDDTDSAEKPAITIQDCPLCGIKLTSSANSRGRHLARHLEDIALPILTMHLEDDEMSEDESSSDTRSEKSQATSSIVANFDITKEESHNVNITKPWEKIPGEADEPNQTMSSVAEMSFRMTQRNHEAFREGHQLLTMRSSPTQPETSESENDRVKEQQETQRLFLNDNASECDCPECVQAREHERRPNSLRVLTTAMSTNNYAMVEQASELTPFHERPSEVRNTALDGVNKRPAVSRREDFRRKLKLEDVNWGSPGESTFQMPQVSDEPSGTGEKKDEDSLANKKNEGSISAEKVTILRNWLYYHPGDLYPTEDEQLDLALQTGLTIKRVNDWFVDAWRVGPPSPDHSGHRSFPFETFPTVATQTLLENRLNETRKNTTKNVIFWPRDLEVFNPTSVRLTRAQLSPFDDSSPNDLLEPSSHVEGGLRGLEGIDIPIESSSGTIHSSTTQYPNEGNNEDQDGEQDQGVGLIDAETVQLGLNHLDHARQGWTEYLEKYGYRGANDDASK